MNPPPDPSESKPAAKGARGFRTIRILTALLLAPAVLLGGAYVGRHLWHRHLEQRLDTLDERAERLYDRSDLEGTMRLLHAVVKESPFNVRALRLWARVLDDTAHNPEDATALWRLLCSNPEATPEDRAALGCALLRACREKEAQALWEHLPQQERQRRGGLELEAALQRYEGRLDAADEILRRAYAADPADPDSRLKLAELNLTSPFPEIQQAAEQTIWEIARRGNGATVVRAMKTLASMSRLTPAQAKELYAQLHDLPEVTGAPRYAVLSGCMKAMPQERAHILKEELERHQGSLGEESADFLRWLLKNSDSQQLFSLLDEKAAMKSARLFAIYAEALKEAGRWSELRTLMHATPAPPLSPASAAVTLAQCSQKLGEPASDARDHLEEALHHSRASPSMSDLLMAASAAEDLGFGDLALESFTELAKHRAFRLGALDHILQIRHREGNLPEVISTLETLLEDAPGLAPYLDLLCYHKILAGEEIEKTTALARHAVESGRQNSPTLHLALALGAFRAHDLAGAQREASAVAPGDLPPGQRAVLAGILEACGHTSEAFHLAEKISAPLLLTEESLFLKGIL